MLENIGFHIVIHSGEDMELTSPGAFLTKFDDFLKTFMGVGVKRVDPFDLKLAHTVQGCRGN